MRKTLKGLALPLIFAAAIGSCCGIAYASPNFGILHEQHVFYNLSYVYRNGWECVSKTFPTLEANSWMWVRNNIRSVGGGAIFSQAGLTNINMFTLENTAVYGSGIWNSGSNPAGQAVESHVAEMVPMYSSVVSWGNGFVRDPDCQYHHCPTEENTVFAYSG